MTIEKILLSTEPKKENLLKVIRKTNKHFGFFSSRAVKLTARHFDLEEMEVYSAASFYDQINTKKPPQLKIQVCDGANCQTKGVDKIIEAIEAFSNQKEGDDNNPKLKIERMSCLGRCLQGPNVIINGTIYEKMDTGKVIEILGQYT